MKIVLASLTEEFSHEKVVQQCARVRGRDPKQRRQRDQIEHAVKLANEQGAQEISDVQ